MNAHRSPAVTNLVVPLSDNLRDINVEVTLEIPEDLALHFARDANGLSRAALEALTLEGLRSGKLTTAQGRRMLGIRSRYEMDGFLKEHRLFLLDTVEAVIRDTDTALTFME